MNPAFGPANLSTMLSRGWIIPFEGIGRHLVATNIPMESIRYLRKMPERFWPSYQNSSVATSLTQGNADHGRTASIYGSAWAAK
jgi:hypothetical protein